MMSVASRPRFDLSQVELHVDGIDVDRAVRAYQEFGLFVVRGLLRPYMDRLLAETEQAVQRAHDELPHATEMRYGWLTTSGAIIPESSPAPACPRRRARHSFRDGLRSES